MQKDMHFFGIFALARAAGMRIGAAKTVANASEYVDDAIWDKDFYQDKGQCILTEMTAHKTLDLKNADSEDQRKVWLPFHFLPGGEGNTVTDRLVCRMNSRIAKAMVKTNTAIAAEAPYGLYLLGITAHVYADTFAHYGFLGANDECNAIKTGSIELKVNDHGVLDYIENKAKSFWNEMLSYGLSQIFPLGHGAAATYPDRPYLRWAYTSEEDNTRVERENPNDFVLACKALYEMFKTYLDKKPNHAEAGVAKSWQKIRTPVKEIIEKEGAKEERIQAWKNVMRAGRLFGGNVTIPTYKGKEWSDSLNEIESKGFPDNPVRLPVYNFYQAARMHRAQMLSDLLPAKGIIAA